MFFYIFINGGLVKFKFNKIRGFLICREIVGLWGSGMRGDRGVLRFGCGLVIRDQDCGNRVRTLLVLDEI